MIDEYVVWSNPHSPPAPEWNNPTGNVNLVILTVQAVMKPPIKGTLQPEFLPTDNSVSV